MKHDQSSNTSSIDRGRLRRRRGGGGCYCLLFWFFFEVDNYSIIKIINFMYLWFCECEHNRLVKQHTHTH